MIVSVILPNRQRAGLLREALYSLVDQTFQGWEAIVVDDGSTDESEAVVNEFGARDPRVRWTRRDRQPPGASTCRNIGAAEARGRYLLFLDSDDLLAPYCLEQRVAYLHERDHLGYSVFPMMVFRDAPLDQRLLWNVMIPEEVDPQKALHRFVARDPPWQTSMPIWRRDAVTQLGGWTEDTSNWQDWDFHVRALAARLEYSIVATAPDCFLRRGAQLRISGDDVAEEAVRDKAIVFRRVLEVLRASDLWSDRLGQGFSRLLLHYAERTAILGRPWPVVESLLLPLGEEAVLGRTEPRWLRTYLRAQHRLAVSGVPLLPGSLYRLVRLAGTPFFAAPRAGLHRHAVSEQAVRSIRVAWEKRAHPVGIDWNRELTAPAIDAA